MNQFDWTKYNSGPQWLKERTIYLTISGSYSYNTQIEGISDLDIRGICIPPKEYYLGFYNRFEQAECKDPDLTVFDLKKFIHLSAEGNPNFLELLYTEPEDRLIVTSLGQKLIDNRELFLSKKCKYTYSGYAYSQLHRLVGKHNLTSDVRHDLYMKHGMDTKAALHTVRLTLMCREILTEGKIIVKRPDAEFLLSIRNGAWTYKQLFDWYTQQELELDELYEKSTLPFAPDREALDKLCVELVEEGLYGKNHT